ncbi:MAG: Gfo/Idh/MocA family oxidoreductase [Candidatus Eisenbacteria bacterium]
MIELTRIAVIGCGRWGPHHIRNFNSLQEAKVVTVVDSDPARLAHVCDLYTGIGYRTDCRGVFEDPQVDAVVVATPTSTHYELVHEALMADKHVLCEKPLCKTSEQAIELAELARSRDRILMVGHVFLFNSGIAKLKEIIDSGTLGEMYYMSAVRTNLGPIRDDVDVAYDLATHDISIFNWLLGSEPESVSATGGSFIQPGIEDAVFLSLKYPGNVIANIQASWLNPKKVRQITTVGSKKMVTWDDLDLNTPVAIYDRGANAKNGHGDYGEFLRISMWDGDVSLPKVRVDEPLKSQNKYFLDAIERGTVERSDGKFAVGVMKVLEATSESLKRDGSSVQIVSAVPDPVLTG